MGGILGIFPINCSAWKKKTSVHHNFSGPLPVRLHSYNEFLCGARNLLRAIIAVLSPHVTCVLLSWWIFFLRVAECVSETELLRDAHLPPSPPLAVIKRRLL